MGRLHNGLNGGFSGRVGNIVGAHWRSIPYIRSAPQKSKKPRTEKQRAQEEKLGMASHFLSPFRNLLEIGFGQAPGTGTGCNKATTLLMTTAIRGTYPNYCIDYPAVRISMGGAEPAMNLRASLEDRSLSLHWDGPEDPFNAEPEDRAMILLFAEEEEAYYGSEGECSRAGGSWQLQLEEFFAGSMLHIWLFFVSARNGRSSESRYVSLRVPGERAAHMPPAITMAARKARKKQS